MVRSIKRGVEYEYKYPGKLQTHHRCLAQSENMSLLQYPIVVVCILALRGRNPYSFKNKITKILRIGRQPAPELASPLRPREAGSEHFFELHVLRSFPNRMNAHLRRSLRRLLLYPDLGWG